MRQEEFLQMAGKNYTGAKADGKPQAEHIQADVAVRRTAFESGGGRFREPLAFECWR